MLEVPYLPAPVDEPTCTGRFVAAGVVLVLIALLCGCLSALTPVGYLIQKHYAAQSAGMTVSYNHPGVVPHNSTPPVIPLAQVIGAAGMYLAVTVAAGWLGIAAFLRHRYVRPLVLVFSTQGIIFGALSVAMMAALMPIIFEQARYSNPATGPAATIGLIVGMAIAGLFFVVPPIVLLVLMKPDVVRRAAERYDLTPRWTDGIPIRVLGLMLTVALFAASEIFILIRPMLPAFTTFLTGTPARLLALVHMAVLAWATVRIYRRDMLGWRVAFWGIVLPLAAFTISTVTMPMDQYMQAIKDQANAAELMADHVTLVRATWIALAVVFLMSFVIYMLRVRPLVEADASAEPATAHTR